jgi:hypothetical protein
LNNARGQATYDTSRKAESRRTSGMDSPSICHVCETFAWNYRFSRDVWFLASPFQSKQVTRAELLRDMSWWY